MAVIQYVQDYDGAYPYTWGVNMDWRTVINPYIKSSDQVANDETGASMTGVWRCPSDTSGPVLTWLNPTTESYVLQPSYAANSMVFGGGMGAGPAWFTQAKATSIITEFG